MRKFAANSVDNFPFNKQDKNMSIRCLNIFNDIKSYEEKFRENFDEYFTVDESNFKINNKKKKENNLRKIFY